jgi:3-deoxy-manno-octulosonate cytidylyltransferase (CMP-KDO synthetase)
MPTLDPHIIGDVFRILENNKADIATLAVVITDMAEKTDPAVVKIALAENGKALYFSRSLIPSGEGVHYHHIGIYAYRRAALEKFVSLPPSPLEQREKLEQLRALEAGMNIFASVVDTVPLGVDTKEGLEKARRFYESV